jgi:hypothetical protein
MIRLCREDEMIWQDPVDFSHITYEYDHSLLDQVMLVVRKL